MKLFRRILVCIGRPEPDARMLEQVAAVSRLAGSLEVHLLHVSSEEDELVHPSHRVVRETLEGFAKQYLGEPANLQIRCEIVPGEPLVEIVRYMHEKMVDLLVIGGRASGHESILARRVTRRSTCSVLVLPENTPLKLEHILVPVRDSKCSARALETACTIATATQSRVTCLNIFRVHSDYSPVGASLEEQTQRLGQLADLETESLLRKVDTGSAQVTSRSLPAPYGKQLDLLLDTAKKESADLFVIGARGRTGAAGVLLGHLTDDLIRESTIPVLAVRRKGECVNLVKALLVFTAQDFDQDS